MYDRGVLSQLGEDIGVRNQAVSSHALCSVSQVHYDSPVVKRLKMNRYWPIDIGLLFPLMSVQLEITNLGRVASCIIGFRV